MNMIDCFDCANAVAKIDEIKAAGVKAIGLYYFEQSAFKQRLDLATAKSLSAAGIYLVSIFEQDPVSIGYFDTGRGTRDAQSAHNQMQMATQPRNTGVYFTVDFEVDPKNYGVIADYFAEIRAVLRPYYLVGCYGQGELLKYLVDHGLIELTFRSESSSFPGYRDAEAWADILQLEETTMFGMSVDTCQTNGHAGGWVTS